MKRMFVTGTGTGVGKTFVTCALARAARERGLRVFAFKPIETGCEGQLGDDQQKLVEAAGGWQTGALAGLYRFSRPVAPAVAAAEERTTIDLERIVAVMEQGSVGADLVLVEGAGGWRVPISDQLEMRDLARRVGPVLVVAQAALGTINHSLLTLEAIERDGLSVAALVLSKRSDDDPWLLESNRTEIGKRWQGRIVDLATVAELLALRGLVK